jgi:excisionase family DNA binding protein
MAEFEMPDLLTPGEVAQVFRVDPKTVNRWAKMGRLRFVRTMGGHRRYYKIDIDQFLNDSTRSRNCDEQKLDGIEQRTDGR